MFSTSGRRPARCNPNSCLVMAACPCTVDCAGRWSCSGAAISNRKYIYMQTVAAFKTARFRGTARCASVLLLRPTTCDRRWSTLQRSLQLSKALLHGSFNANDWLLVPKFVDHGNCASHASCSPMPVCPRSGPHAQQQKWET